MDLSVVEQAEAEVSQPGAATAPAHTLYDVVRKLPEGSRVAIERSATGPRSPCAPAAAPSICRACRRPTSRP